MGIDKTEEILQTYQKTNDIELITSAYFDAEDRELFSASFVVSYTNCVVAR